MYPSASLWVFLAGMALTLADTPADMSPAGTQPQPQSQPTYQNKPVDPIASYTNSYSSGPAAAYNYDAGYGVQNPSLYDYMIASNYPNVKTTEHEMVDPVYPVGSWLPTFRQVLSVMVKVFSKLGFILLGGAGLLVVGMALTTAVCTLTPVCQINWFTGQGVVSQETVRAMLTPEKITATAQFVQQAIDKYQQLQRVVN